MCTSRGLGSGGSEIVRDERYDQSGTRRAASGDTVTEANAADFDPRADDVFDRIAARYDVLSDLFSLGIHRLWKRRMAALIAAEPWQTMLDAATGTGDVVLAVARRLPTLGDRRIIASDLSERMLAKARRRSGPARPELEFQLLDAHAMPSIPDASVDLYSMSLGLKICDRKRALAEAWRVLRPGGRLITLEASEIVLPWLHRVYLGYMRLCMPTIGWLATGGDASAYRYLLKGVSEFPGAERLAHELGEMGFEDVLFERMTLGIVAIHTARKPG